MVLAIFNQSFFSENILLFGSVFLVTTLGLMDDIKGSLPIVKIAVLIVAYVILFLDGYLISDLGDFLSMRLELNYIVAILFTLFVIVAFTNAFNLIDGLDGLSGLVSVVTLASFLFIGYINDDQFLTIIPTLFISSIIVFLFFNWYPAKVFLGDSGSLMIGFIISVLGIKSLDYIEPIAIFYIAAIPIIDSIIVFWRRITTRLSPFVPDKSHLHHVLLYYFEGNIVKTVITIGSIQAFFSIVGITIVSNVDDSFISLMIFIIFLITMYKLLTNRYLIQQRNANN
jgi:UDP-GlcNAc:undecaprenyl-phosphate GlcNAc-1-phosphate transferase